MSIHDRYELAFPFYVVGIGLMVLAGFLTTFDSRAENVVIETVIVAELKFSDIERQVLGADFVERANDTAFEDTPETFNCLGVNRADNVLPSRMVNGGMRVVLIQSLVAQPIDRCRAN